MGDPTPPRKRARQACTSCNSRKVKCDVTVTGIPCTNCQRDATLTCETVRRKVHRHRQTLPAPVHLTPPEVHSINVDPVLIATAQEADSADINGLPDDNSLSYLGDRHGPRNYVYEICGPTSPQDPRQTTVHQRWKPHQLQFLQSENAFTPFDDAFTNTLIRCYFEHMHFFFPVLDVQMFFRDALKQDGRCWLLYWSVMLAGANFVGPEQLRNAGYSSRKGLKRATYARAKCLYDLDLGSDNLILVQATTLMSFWYSDNQERTGAWYWIGCAISLAQALGLHRASRSTSHHSTRNEPFARRIWWTLVVRDRWLSLAKGRPMRINESDCDIAAPGLNDITDELYQLPSSVAAQYLPLGYEVMSGMWISLVHISAVLGRIVKAHYGIQPRDPYTAVAEIAKHRDELLGCKPYLDDGGSRDIQLHGCHLELFYQMAVIVLYRPYALESILDQSSTADASDRARSAVAAMGTVLERIIRLDGVDVLKPMAITALVPSMQIHLFDCRSSNPAMRALGKNKLELYLVVLAQLQKTYWSADVFHRLFTRSLAIVLENTAANSLGNHTESSQPAIPQPAEAQLMDQFDIDQLFAVDLDLFNPSAWFPTELTGNPESIGQTDFAFW